jgi:hypothetical protein
MKHDLSCAGAECPDVMCWAMGLLTWLTKAHSSVNVTAKWSETATGVWLDLEASGKTSRGMWLTGGISAVTAAQISALLQEFV